MLDPALPDVECSLMLRLALILSLFPSPSRISCSRLSTPTGDRRSVHSRSSPLLFRAITNPRPRNTHATLWSTGTDSGGSRHVHDEEFRSRLENNATVRKPPFASTNLLLTPPSAIRNRHDSRESSVRIDSAKAAISGWASRSASVRSPLHGN